MMMVAYLFVMKYYQYRGSIVAIKVKPNELDKIKVL